MQQRQRTLAELKNASCLSYFAKQVQRQGNEEAVQSKRVNRFKGNNPRQIRSLSESISSIQVEEYNKLFNKNLRRERSQLSHSRFNKMRQVILREIQNVIPEAKHEPTATCYVENILISIAQ